jgi:ferredoxin-NADP reductase
MQKEIQARIKEIIQRTHNVKSFRVEIKDWLDFKAGQFLQVTLRTEPQLRRYLSISSSPTEKGYIEFTKKITDSDFSKALNSLKAQDEVIVKYPFGTFVLQESFSKIAFISGGIGITPIRSICKYIVDKKLGVDVDLVYSNRTINDIAFKDDFEAMRKIYPKLKISHVLCEQALDFKCLIGTINSQVIKDEVKDYLERKFYLCGPPAMVESMKKMLTLELGLPQSNIITENFQGY